jgi:hypothetical protein
LSICVEWVESGLAASVRNGSKTELMRYRAILHYSQFVAEGYDEDEGVNGVCGLFKQRHCWQ